MADPFSIVGVIGVAIQITQVVVQCGLDWKDAPQNIRAFMAELQTLKTVLSETNTNILLNPDFAEAFQNRPSLLLSQLGQNTPSTTDTKLMLAVCHKELENLLVELRKRAKGRRISWERFKGTFLAKNTRESVENLHRQCQILNGMVTIDATVLGATTYKEVKEARKEQWDWRQAKTDQEILTWLTNSDYGAQHSDFMSRRQEGSGRWLLDSGDFQRWSNEDKQTLFCQGMPGAGKTVMASIVIDHLHTKYQNDDSIGIAYLYCNFRRKSEQEPTNMLASLLKQLIYRLPSLPESVRSLYERHKSKQTRPLFDEISKELQFIVVHYGKAFIIIDALDECQTSNNSWKRFLSEIYRLQERVGVNFFVTSRFIPEIRREFQGSLSLEIRASDEDVRKYLDCHMLQLPSFVINNPDLQKEIETEVIKAVDGMFLLAQLHLDSLKGKRSPKALRSALKILPTGSEAYDHAYKEAMKRIESQNTDSQKLAKQVLSWITCAKRPLTTSELRHALAVEIGECGFDKENLSEIEDMVSVCAGLVTIDEESNVIRLIHYTTQEYFERTWTSWFPNAQEEIAKTCVTYLSFDDFEAGFCSTDEEFDARLELNPFYEYAARNWGYHVNAASTNIQHLILEFLENRAKVSSSSQAMIASEGYRYHIYYGYSQVAPEQMTGANLAAYFGLGETIIALLGNGHRPNIKDIYGRTPLSWAANKGHETVVRQLLKRADVEANSKDRDGRTPLSEAADNGHETVVRQLLKRIDVEADSKDFLSRTPLSRAADNGHEAVVRQLLERADVEADSKDLDGRTPLSRAADNGHEAVVRQLLERADVEADSKDFLDRTPLSGAADNGHEAVVRQLLERADVEADSKDFDGRTPLSRAAEYGHEAVVRLLQSHNSQSS